MLIRPVVFAVTAGGGPEPEEAVNNGDGGCGVSVRPEKLHTW